MGTHDFRWMGDRVERLLDGGSPMADTMLENASLRSRIAALESQLADRHAERVSEIDAHMERVAGLEAKLAQYRWRRVEDEMPANGDLVLVVHERYSGPPVIAYHLNSGWTWAESGDPMLVDPHYWMPLPPAPEEGE